MPGPGLNQYTELGAVRSMRRYLGQLLPAPWDVQLVRREPQTRPLCVVRFIGPTLSTGSAYVKHFNKLCEIWLYPAGQDGDPVYGDMEARDVCDVVVRGLDSGNTAAGGYACRVPFFDYSNVAYNAVLPGTPTPFDYLQLSQISGEVRTDPDQDDLFSVIVQARVAWSDDGDTHRYDGPTITGFKIKGPVYP